MSRRTSESWVTLAMDPTSIEVRRATIVDRLLDAFVLLVFLAPFGLAATILAWLDIGTWTAVLTWGGSISSGTLLLGIVAAVVGNRRDRARRVDVTEERHR